MQPLPPIPLEWLPSDAEPEWARLDAFQRADVLRRLQLVALVEEELARGGKRVEAFHRAAGRAKEFSLGARDRHGGALRKCGIGWLALYRLHAQWEKVGGDWLRISRYRKLIADKGNALRTAQLDVKRVRAFFRRTGGAKRWCRENQVSHRVVEALLASNRHEEPATIAAARKIQVAIRWRIKALQAELREIEGKSPKL